MSLRHTRSFSGAIARQVRLTLPFFAVRPQAPSPQLSSVPEPEPKPRRFGLLFLLAGACLATWLIKPTYKPPSAAFDPVRRRVCIVFLFGNPTPADIKKLTARGFTYVHLPDQSPKACEAQLQPLVSSGKTWLAISGVPQDKIKEFEEFVVQCDLGLLFGNSNSSIEALHERLVPVTQPLDDILDAKNM